MVGKVLEIKDLFDRDKLAEDIANYWFISVFGLGLQKSVSSV